MNRNENAVVISLGVLLGLLLILIVCVLRKYIQTVQKADQDFDHYNIHHYGENDSKKRHSSSRFVNMWFPFFDTEKVEAQVQHSKRPRRWNLKKSPPHSPTATQKQMNRARYQSLPNLSLGPNSSTTKQGRISEAEDEFFNDVFIGQQQHPEKPRAITFAEGDQVNLIAKRFPPTISMFGSSLTSLDEDSSSPTAPAAQTVKVLRYCKTNGYLEFTTQYFTIEHLLEVHIFKLSGFSVNTDKNPKFGLSFWVSAYLDPGKQKKSETDPQIGDEPFFNEKIQFTSMDDYSLKRSRLVLKVYFKHRKKHHKELLGMVNMDLASLDICGVDKEAHQAPLYSL